MRISLLLWAVCLLGFSGFAQNFQFRLPERQSAVVRKTTLGTAQTMNDLSPVLWSSLNMPNNERFWLQQRRPDVFPQPQNYLYPQDNYGTILSIVSLEITGVSNGKKATLTSANEKLTTGQQQLVANVDLGSELTVKFRFKYKDQSPDNFGDRNKPVDCTAAITVVPDKEAEFPGGYHELSNYIAKNVIALAPDAKAAEKVTFATIKFTVNENGEVQNVSLARGTSLVQMDLMLLNALNKMPKWKPALDSKGNRVKQEFVIPFNVGC